VVYFWNKGLYSLCIWVLWVQCFVANCPGGEYVLPYTDYNLGVEDGTVGGVVGGMVNMVRP